MATLWARLAAILAAILAGLGSGRAEEATMQIVAHPRFVRILVLAETAPAARLDLEGAVARLRFAQPLRFVVPPVPAGAGGRLVAAELRDGGRQLALALGPGVTARRAEGGPGRLAIDLVAASDPSHPRAVDPPAPDPPEPAAGSAKSDSELARGLRVRSGRHPTHLRLVLEGSRTHELRVRIAPPGLELAGPADLLPGIARNLEALAPAVTRVTTDGGTLAVELAPGMLVLPVVGRPDQIVLDLRPPSQPAAAAPGPPTTAPSPAASTGELRHRPGFRPGAEIAPARPPGCGEGGDRLCVSVEPAPDGASVRLAVAPRPALAVLVRAGAAWAVLDRLVEVVETAETLPDVGAPLVRSVSRVEHVRATLLRIELGEPAAVRAVPIPEGWRVELRRGAATPPTEEMAPRRLADPPALAIPATGRIVRLPASLLGSEVEVLPTPAGSPRTVARELVDLEFLPTAQGLAWRPVADDLRAREDDGATVIGRPGGLRLDTAPVPAESSTESPTAAAGTETTTPEPDPIAADVPAPPTPEPAPEAHETAPKPEMPSEPRPPAEVRAARAEAEVSTRPRPRHESLAARALPVELRPPAGASDAQPAVPGAADRSAEARADVSPGEAAEPLIGLARARPATPTDAAPQAAAAGAAGRPTEPAAGRGTAGDRARAREELARGRAAEALALLGEPTAAFDPAAEPPAEAATRALVGVAAALLERPQAAARLLDDPRFAADPEVALWRGLVAGQQRDWQSAGREIAASGRTFQTYPPQLQRRLAPLLARILVESGRTTAAYAVVDLARRSGPDPRETARLQLVEGLGHARDGAFEEAATDFRGTAEGADRTAAIEARYRLARLDLERGRTSPTETIAELARQRLHWRDHPAEPEMLEGLALTLAAAGRTGEALETARELAARYPESSRSADAVERSRTLLADALAGTDPGATDPITALRLLRRFGDRLADIGTAPLSALARRLAAAGLPAAAAGLLAERVVPELQGAERALTALELAELRLAADEPRAALDLLRAEAATLALLPEATERAQKLRGAAEALGGDGRPAEYAAARAQQFEAAWRDRDWPRVAELGRSLLTADTPPGTGRRPPELRLRSAVALAALGDSEAARGLLDGTDDSGEAERTRRLVALLAEPAQLRGDALEVARAIDGELALLRAALVGSR